MEKATATSTSCPSTPRWNIDRPFLTGRFHQVFFFTSILYFCSPRTEQSYHSSYEKFPLLLFICLIFLFLLKQNSALCCNFYEYLYLSRKRKELRGSLIPRDFLWIYLGINKIYIHNLLNCIFISLLFL